MTDAHLAETRVVRAMVVVLGVATAIYAALTAGLVLDQARYVQPVWLVPAALVMFAVPPVLAVLARWLSLRVLRRALGLYAIAFLVVVCTWVLAMNGERLPEDVAPWVLGFTGVGTVPAAIAWRQEIGWLALIANSAALSFVRFEATGRADLPLAVQDGIFSLAFCSIFTVIAIVGVRNARALDAAAQSARQSAASAASVAARVHEQARLDALVHDELITALYYATTDRGELTGSVRTQARRALDQLSRLDAGHIEASPVEPDAFARRLRAVLLDLSSRLRFVVRGERQEPIPAEVADAFAEGATEALRNSLRHAGGPQVARRVELTLDEEGVQVEVRDDGKGFDPGAVNPYRLGIRVSIRGRLEAVENGSARVSSRPGQGTVVTLSWRDR